MKKKQKVTIYELAAELNVSPSTVSRALKDHYSIGTETTKAVKKLAAERGYRPNSIAASLRKQKTTNIGVLVSWINRPFISSLISGVEEAAREAGYNVIISQSHDSYDAEVANAKALYDSRVCALVVSLAMEAQQYDHFNQFLESDTPIVFVDRVPEELECHKVVIDNYAAGFKATEHLISQGCKRIAHFGGATHQNIYRERKRGYIDALKRYNLEIDDDLVIYGNVLSAEEGINITQALLDLPNPPDGIFSANDTAAVSAIQYAKSVGVRIPDELAIIGFNNDPICMIVEPQLSSITHPAVEMGKIAIQQALQGTQPQTIVLSQTVTLKTEVAARASSLRKAAGSRG